MKCSVDLFVMAALIIQERNAQIVEFEKIRAKRNVDELVFAQGVMEVDNEQSQVIAAIEQSIANDEDVPPHAIVKHLGFKEAIKHYKNIVVWYSKQK